MSSISSRRVTNLSTHRLVVVKILLQHTKQKIIGVRSGCFRGVPKFFSREIIGYVDLFCELPMYLRDNVYIPQPIRNFGPCL